MTVLSAQTIKALALVHPCQARAEAYGMTWGLGPCGYDVTLDLGDLCPAGVRTVEPGEFILAATRQQFFMPDNVMGMVHDKSSWARRGLCAQNTVIEPGWYGFLTLELTNHGEEDLRLENGMPIAQVVFHFLDMPTDVPYAGRYQNQVAGPQPAL